MFLLCLSSTYLKTDDGKHELDSLLNAVTDGDKKALEQLYALCSPAVYSFALSILRNEEDAKDILQDSFVALYTHAERYRPKGNPMAWILTVTKNLCLMRLRQRKKDGDTPLEDLAFTLTAPEGTSIEDRILIEAALNSLSSEERQIVILHAVAGLRHREIARLLDLALPTVLSKYNRALKKLRKMLT